MEKVHFKIGFVGVLREAREDCLEVCFVGLLVGENYVWCLVLVVIFIGFEGGRSWGKL